MSLTYEEVGDPIARIIDEESGSFKLVYIDEDCENKEGPKLSEIFMNEQLSGEEILHLGESLNQGMTIKQFLSSLDEECEEENACRTIIKERDELVVVIPRRKTERVLMCGAAGVGKSTLAARYAMEWRLQNPDGEIYLFCVFKKDPAYDGINLIEIKVESNITEVNIDIKELTGSLVIFDDMDNLPKEEGKFMHNLINSLMATGRKEDIWVLYLSHVLLRGLETKVINNETNKIFLFTGLGDKQNMDYLKVYAGMDTKQARSIATMKSRWLCLNRQLHRYIVNEKGVMLL